MCYLRLTRPSFLSLSFPTQSSFSSSLPPSLPPPLFQELITALHGIILQYERQFQLAALRYTETEYLGGQTTLTTSVTSTGWIHVQIDAPNEGQEGTKSQRSPHPGSSPCTNGIEGVAAGTYASSSDSSSGEDRVFDGIPRKVPGTQNYGPPVVDRRIQNQATATSSRGVYTQIWRGLHLLASDSCLEVSRRAGSIINSVHCKASKLRLSETHSLTTCCFFLSFIMLRIGSVQKQRASSVPLLLSLSLHLRLLSTALPKRTPLVESKLESLPSCLCASFSPTLFLFFSQDSVFLNIYALVGARVERLLCSNVHVVTPSSS